MHRSWFSFEYMLNLGIILDLQKIWRGIWYSLTQFHLMATDFMHILVLLFKLRDQLWYMAINSRLYSLFH